MERKKRSQQKTGGSGATEIKARTYLEPSDVELMGQQATNLRDRLLVRLLFRLSCRISEALAVTVEDVNFEQGTVTIQHLKMRVNLYCPLCGARLSRTARFCPGCGAHVEEAVAKEREHRRMRTLPLDKDTLKMLKEYIDRGGPVTVDDKQLLFGIGRRQAYRIISDMGWRAGLGRLINPETGRSHHVSPHRLRDAFAVNAMKTDDSAESQRMLQEQLGHDSFNSTAKYRKVAGKEHREWYDKLWQGGDGG